MNTGVTETVVIIVGAGPSGLSTAASLHRLSIPYVILEREDCIASIFNNKSYDRLHLHLTKQFCQLPHMPFPANFPSYVPIKDFLKYLDDYASHFKINPMFHNFVKFAKYDEDRKKWKVEAEIVGGRSAEEEGGVRWYEGKFLVVATGETSDVFIPAVDGLSEFKGEVIHSTEYKSGERFENKKVLVVGAGNSGMEIAFDLSNHGAKTSIVVRSPMHILSRWSTNLGLMSLASMPLHLVDSFLVFVNTIMYGDLTKYGIQRPKEGPFLMKVRDGKYPVIDVGTVKKIKSGEIEVLPRLKNIKGGGNEVVFENGKCYQFDVILFATGFKRSTHLWLQGDDFLINEDGLAKPMYPNHWKGDNGLFCVGLARRGLYGAAMDAQNIAHHVFNLLSLSK
ncbi:probable indole-3-pyruvate monooxygenase YUCCA10 [Cynara cardunculus var. scolymus]|uniref:probable indole-3-pyruvate monooxygenase YUCCA10 n=1 Tax=Cynara cardunculus var. scolymus TaxID=59895 RepID=UPI000D6231AB|nr:probable indole-3-pyruvate monooxygenase YUCCA10 [Cynara cardunculus var. scolymus]